MLVIRHKVTGEFFNARDGWGSYTDADRFTADDFDHMVPPTDGVIIADDELFQACQAFADFGAALVETGAAILRKVRP